MDRGGSRALPGDDLSPLNKVWAADQAILGIIALLERGSPGTVALYRFVAYEQAPDHVAWLGRVLGDCPAHGAPPRASARTSLPGFRPLPNHEVEFRRFKAAGG